MKANPHFKASFPSLTIIILKVCSSLDIGWPVMKSCSRRMNSSELSKEGVLNGRFFRRQEKHVWRRWPPFSHSSKSCSKQASFLQTTWFYHGSHRGCSSFNWVNFRRQLMPDPSKVPEARHGVFVVHRTKSSFCVYTYQLENKRAILCFQQKRRRTFSAAPLRLFPLIPPDLWGWGCLEPDLGFFKVPGFSSEPQQHCLQYN